MDDVEDWALDRATDLFEAEFPVGQPFVGVQWRYAFAKYIAKHEQAPVDPLLIEAREICARYSERRTNTSFYAEKYRSGDWDNAGHMERTMAALKRGMELAKS